MINLKKSSWILNTEARRHKGTEILIEMQTHRNETEHGFFYLRGESDKQQRNGVKFQFLCVSVLNYLKNRRIQLPNLG